jgi:hypothetical protein
MKYSWAGRKTLIYQSIMLIRSMDECKDKQEVVIRFIQKLIPPRDILSERMCSKFKHLRWVVAEDMAMKISKTLYRQTYRKTGSWHRIHTKRNPTIWYATRKSMLKLQASAMSTSVAEKTATKVCYRQTDTQEQHSIFPSPSIRDIINSSLHNKYWL